MRHRGLGSKMVGVAMALGAATAAYLLYIRPWQLRWGATDEELERPMPGDEIVTRPTFNATRAVTIEARPEEIWPWIVQIGMTRAGWYSYDLLDNLGRPSARRILPQFQNLKIGDVTPMSPDGKQGPYVNDFDQERWMLWWDGKGGMSWVWGALSGGRSAHAPDHPGASAIRLEVAVDHFPHAGRVHRHSDDAQEYAGHQGAG